LEITERRDEGKNNFWAIISIVAGVFLLLNQFVSLSWWMGRFFWPGIMIMAGVYLITKNG
jgi:hypothetical protein